MSGGKQLIDRIEIDLLHNNKQDKLTLYLDVFDNSLSRKWLTALNHLLKNNYHLEKNYCFVGFADGPRTPELIINRINQSIAAINAANLGYTISEEFTVENTITPGPVGSGLDGGRVNHDKLNWLHRFFEDLQGQSGHMSLYYLKANDTTRFHISQLNLLCHEYESLILSRRKKIQAPEWRRPSQLMCWLHAPRFTLEDNDYELFGVDTISRGMGAVYVGVNKSVGKHHWEVFNDEGRDSRVGELVTSTLISQTEAAGDFDIEWGVSPAGYSWQEENLAAFRQWLIANNFDPDDKKLTIGHPQVGQIDLVRSFGGTSWDVVWPQLEQHLNVYEIRTSQTSNKFEYNWDDADFVDRQIEIIGRHRQ